MAAVKAVLDAEPRPLDIDLSRTALLIIDMQNAFVKPGGMYDIWFHDVSRALGIIKPIADLAAAARDKGCKVVYTAHCYSSDIHEMGAEDSFECIKSREVYDYVQHPEWRSIFLEKGTWGADIIDELKPGAGDVLVEKARKSAFFETNLDSILRELNLKYLIFVGLAANVCVESTIRDAAFRGYFPILIADATAGFGPPYVLQATVFNVKLCFGWVSAADKVRELLR